MIRKKDPMDGIRPIKREQIFFEDVDKDTEIPPLAKGRFTTSKIAMFSAVYGSFCPGHFDYNMARKFFNQDRPIAFGNQVCGAYLSQLLTDWIGPNGILKRFKSQMRAPVFDGDSLIMRGKVIKKNARDSENYVECEIWAENQGGNVVASGTATVILPSKTG